MYDYRLLEAFASVVENKGFEKAAAVLHITQSAVSQRVRLLEENLGQILLVRANPPHPTEEGKKLLAHFSKVRLLEMELTTDGTESAFIPLSIGLNADSLATWFFDAVQTPVQQNGILLDLHIDDQDETHRMLKDGEVSGCISTRDKPFQSCTCSFIGTMTYRMFCASDRLESFFPKGISPEAMQNVPVVIFNRKDNLPRQMFDLIFGFEPEYPRMYVPSVDQYMDAVLRGFGLGMMPDSQCAGYLESGRLKDAFSPFKVTTDLYWHRWSLSSKPLDILSRAILKNSELI